MTHRHVIIELEPDTEIERVGVRIGRETLWLDVTGAALSGEGDPLQPDDEGPYICPGDVPLPSFAWAPQKPARHESWANNSLAQVLTQRKRDAQRSKGRIDE